MQHELTWLSAVRIGRRRFVATVGSRNFASAVASRRTYNDAIDLLNTLQTPYAVYQERVKAGLRPDASFMAEMRDCLARIGHSPADLDRLNVLHVAGTKGKGSTCAFADSILNRWRLARGVPAKIGLFTSPHLVSVRERIKINSLPVSEEVFASCFFEVWDLLERNPPSCALGSGQAAVVCGGEEAGQSHEQQQWHRQDPASWNAGSYRGKPIYGRYLTLMSWHLFLAEHVDVAVVETGIGGEYDATNVVERPCAVAITSLGIDHIFHLGGTIEEIAWHKAGVMKAGVPAFTVRHEAHPAAEQVLRRRAAERDVSRFEVLDVDPRLEGVRVRPDVDFQRRNATLAIALAEAALKRVDTVFDKEQQQQRRRSQSSSCPAALPKEFVDGIEQVIWRGRCEVKEEDGVRWHVDGAHTLDSLMLAGSWFAGEVKHRPGPRVLIFNQQGRTEAARFLPALYQATKSVDGRCFDRVIFCSNRTHSSIGFKRESINHTVDATKVDNLTMQRAFAREWAKLDPGADVFVAGSIQQAIEQARQLALCPGTKNTTESQADGKDGAVNVFVTGSIHLVGGVLGILDGAKTL